MGDFIFDTIGDLGSAIGLAGDGSDVSGLNILVLLPDLLYEGLSTAGEVREPSASAPAWCALSERPVGDFVALAADAIASAQGLVLTDSAERSGISEP